MAIKEIDSKKDVPTQLPKVQAARNKPQPSPEDKEKKQGIQELSTNKIVDYINKSSVDIVKKRFAGAEKMDRTGKAEQRVKYLDKARVKITKESYDSENAAPSYCSYDGIKTKALMKALANKAADLLILMSESDIEYNYWMKDSVKQALVLVNEIHDTCTFKPNP